MPEQKPVIDPTTGKPVEPPANDPPMLSVPAEEWGAIKGKLDTFEKMGARFDQPPPVAPAAPAGPTFSDQVKEIDGQIGVLNTQIDEAIKGGQGVSALLTERDTLTHKRTRMQIKHEDIDPAMALGVETIDQLSAELARGKMKHYDLVKDDVEDALKGLPAEQRMNPQMRQAAYDIAVGKNIDKILEAQKEELLRKPTDGEGGGEPPASKVRGAGDDTLPKPEDILSRQAIAAIRAKGVTVDEYYKKLGHPEGWKGHFEKHKSHYEEMGAI